LKHTTISILFFFALTFFSVQASAQLTIKGTVFDSSRRYTVEAVTVQSTSGRYTMTDSLGRYTITAGEKDSIWFSYLGKPTPKYPVAKMQDITQFNISLLLKSNIMREVRIRSRTYKEDSLQNRKDYAKVFNWRRPNLETLTSVNNMGVGFDLQEIIRVFQFRKNRSMQRFRQRLIEQEQEKYIDYRFNRGLIKRLTGLEGAALEEFIRQYKPTYAFVVTAPEYDFQLYIKQAGEEFKTGNKSF
jgi:hypothetical protein